MTLINVLTPHIFHLNSDDFQDVNGLPAQEVIIIKKLCEIINVLHGMAWLSTEQLRILRNNALVSRSPSSQFQADCSFLLNNLVSSFPNTSIPQETVFSVSSISDIIKQWYPNDTIQLPAPLETRAWMLETNELVSVDIKVSTLLEEITFNLTSLIQAFVVILAQKNPDNLRMAASGMFLVVTLNQLKDHPELRTEPEAIQSVIKISQILNEMEKKELSYQTERLYLLLQLRLLLLGADSVPTVIINTNVQTKIDKLISYLNQNHASSILLDNTDPWYHDTHLTKLMNFFQCHDDLKTNFPAYRIPLQGYILAPQSPFLKIEDSDYAITLFKNTIQEQSQLSGRSVLPINIHNGNIQSDLTQAGAIFGNHWVLLLIDTEEKSIVYIDPTGNGLGNDICFNITNPNFSKMPAEKRYYTARVIQLVQEALDDSALNYTVTITGLMQQPEYNINDCGVFAVTNAMAWLKHEEFTTHDANLLRENYHHALQQIMLPASPPISLFEDDQCAPRLTLELEDFPESERAMRPVQAICFMANTLYSICILNTPMMAEIKNSAQRSFLQVVPLLNEAVQSLNAEIPLLKLQYPERASQIRDIANIQNWCVELQHIGFKCIIPELLAIKYGSLLAQNTPKQLKTSLQQQAQVILSLSHLQPQLTLDTGSQIDIKPILFWIVSGEWGEHREEVTFFLEKYQAAIMQNIITILQNTDPKKSMDYLNQIVILTTLAQQYILATQGTTLEKAPGLNITKRLIEPVRFSEELQSLLVLFNRADINPSHPDLNYSLRDIHQLIEFYKMYSKPFSMRAPSPTRGQAYRGVDVETEIVQALATPNCRSVIPIHLLKTDRSNPSTVMGDHYALLTVDTTTNPIKIMLVNPLGNSTSGDVSIILNQEFSAVLAQKNVKAQYIDYLKPLLELVVGVLVSQTMECELSLPQYSHQTTAHDSSVLIVHYAIAFLVRGIIPNKAPDLADLRERYRVACRHMRAYLNEKHITPVELVENIIPEAIATIMAITTPLEQPVNQVISTTAVAATLIEEILEPQEQPLVTSDEVMVVSPITTSENISDIQVTDTAPDAIPVAPLQIPINKQSQDECIMALTTYFQANTVGRVTRDVPLFGNVFPCQMPRTSGGVGHFENLLVSIDQTLGYSCVPINLANNPTPKFAQWIVLGFNPTNRVITCITPNPFARLASKTLAPLLQQLVSAGWSIETIATPQNDANSQYSVVLNTIALLENNGQYQLPVMTQHAFQATCESIIQEIPTASPAPLLEQPIITSIQEIPTVSPEALLGRLISSTKAESSFQSKRFADDQHNVSSSVEATRNRTARAHYKARYSGFGYNGEIEEFNPDAKKGPAFDPQTAPFRRKIVQLPPVADDDSFLMMTKALQKAILTNDDEAERKLFDPSGYWVDEARRKQPSNHKNSNPGEADNTSSFSEAYTSLFTTSYITQAKIDGAQVQPLEPAEADPDHTSPSPAAKGPK